MSMSKARLKVTERYVQKMARLMNLGHYTVMVSPDYETEFRGNDVFALTETQGDGSIVTINFSEAFYQDTPSGQRNTVCHELIHPHLDPVFQHVYGSKVIKGEVGVSLFAFIEESGRSLVERAVDQMANGWAELLPLPPKFPK